MDAKNSIVSEVTIQDGVITGVGKTSGRLSPCTRVVDLKGRTAVPGLVDNHNHIVLLGLRPGTTRGSRPRRRFLTCRR